MAFLESYSTAQKLGYILAAIFYIVAGILHFAKPGFYLKIMPPYIPWHQFMVQASGACEILGSLGLLLPRTRRAAAWGLILLLVAVLPANIYMATNPVDTGALAISPLLRWGRLPLQLLLMWWLLWSTATRAKSW